MIEVSRMEIQQVLLGLSSSFILTPLIAISLVFFYVYRRIVDIVLRVKLKDKYAGLLDGSDGIWAVEEESSLAVINVLAILEKDARHSNVSFLNNFRDLVKTRLIDSSFEKLLYARRKRFGYYFWERNREIDLEKRVRWLEYERTSCDGSCDNVYNGHLKRVLTNVCNQPLPEDHSASWEILVGKSCPRSSHHYLRRMEERLSNRKIRIPILFRVHHSLADGVALLKLLLNAIADDERSDARFRPDDAIITEESDDCNTITLIVPQMSRGGNPSAGKSISLSYSRDDDLLSARMPFTYFRNISHVQESLRGFLRLGLKYAGTLTAEEFLQEVSELLEKKWAEVKDFVAGELCIRLRAIFKMICMIISAPACLIRQSLRSVDHSALHGPKLTGEKIISYWLEDDFRRPDEEKLLTKVQSIKRMTGAGFEDVLLAALSASLHKHFLRVNGTAPSNVSVVLPSKVEDDPQHCSLQNNFTVGLLRLCVSEINGEVSENPKEDSRVLERLQDIRNAKAELLNSSDHVVNFLVINYLSAALPEPLLRPLLESHSTLVFSNLIGPEEVKISGHSLKNIAFWIPNRSYTGIGCSLLSYRGYLHLSLMADRALVPDDKFLTAILENTVREVDLLYDKLTLSSSSKQFDHNVSTPIVKDVGVL